jgi:hypothetical protein
MSYGPGGGAGGGISYNGGGNLPPSIQLKDLYARRQNRDLSRLRAYEQILQQIMNRIRQQSDLPTHPTSLLYTVPRFVLGLPMLDLKDCILFLVHQLRSSGLEVKYTYPDLLYISWRHYEHEYMKRESPIYAAMLASASTAADEQEKKRAEAEAARIEAARPASERRKPKKSVSFSSGRESKPAGIRADPPVSALSYNPSMDFLNAVEKPTEKRQQSEGEKAFKSLFDF